MVALAITLMCTAWAQPKFRILSTVPGGLFSGLTLDAKGDLFGVTGGGGTYDDGTIFELSPGAHGWTLNTIHSFDGYDGGAPNGTLIFDAKGNMYGATPEGGTFGGGVVFEMMPGAGGWTYQVLYDFCPQYHCPDGGVPQWGVTLDPLGNLYGIGAGGGAHGQGVVFELTKGSDGWSEEPLFSFDDVKTGLEPSGTLLWRGVDELYGTTASGGRVSSLCYFGCGMVFGLKHHLDGRWDEASFFRFNGTDGAGPYYGIVGRSGDLYGTTQVGGGTNGFGVVFKLTPSSKSGWRQTLLYEFRRPEDGEFPSSGVAFDKAGNLYGTTSNGGNPICASGCGVVYKLTPAAGGKWEYSVLHKFSGSDGGYPGGGVVIGRQGNLYGTAYNVVFEITP